MRIGSPGTMAERQACKAALADWGVSWTELKHRLGGRGMLAKHLLAGRQAPRGQALAAMPDAVVIGYVERLRMK